MARRMSKGAALAALDQQIAEGQRLWAAAHPDCAWADPLEEVVAIAQLGVERLAWAQGLRSLFPQMSQGMQLAADFRRASAAEAHQPSISLADDRLRVHEGLARELGVLSQAVERWRRSGTRPLHEGLTGPIAEGPKPSSPSGPLPSTTAPLPLDLPPLPPVPELPPPEPLPPVPRALTAPIPPGALPPKRPPRLGAVPKATGPIPEA